MPTDTFEIAASGDDGSVNASGASWPIAAAGSVDTSSDVTSTYLALNGATYYNQQTLLRWDTSSIPNDATITAATLRVYCTGLTSVDNRAIAAQWYDWGASIDTSDYSASPTADAHAGTTIQGNFAPDADADLALLDPADHINTTGYTYLKIYTTGGQPTGDNYIEFATYDHASLAAARLLVTYTVGTTTGHARLVGPSALTTSAATYYTAPTGEIARIETISISNTSGSPVDLTLSIGTDSAGTRYFDAWSIPADSEIKRRVYIPLAAEEIIQSFASTDAVLILTIDGTVFAST